MSGSRYAQATTEESTELVTNRASANPSHWNTAILSNQQPSLEAHRSTNLVTGLADLHLRENDSRSVAQVASPYSLSAGSVAPFTNLYSERHAVAHAEITETCPTPVPVVNHYLRVEKNRLDTFSRGWPVNAPVQPRDLAKAGFYYLNTGDVVRCAFCQLTLKHWERGDIPLNEHSKYSPSCLLVQQQDAGNVPLHDNLLQSPTGTFPPEWRNMFRSQSQASCMEYADVNNRLRSFAGHKLPAGQTGEAMANAGFFYIGPDDNVKCYWCGGCLKRWEPTDQPMVEHMRWFPECQLSRQATNVPMQPSVSAATGSIQESISVYPPSSEESYSVSQPVEEEMETVEAAGNEAATTVSSVNMSGHSPESKDVENLKEENRRLRDTMLCKICMDRDISTLFLPCSHLVCCGTCAPTLRECPMCRTPIRGTVHTYIS